MARGKKSKREDSRSQLKQAYLLNNSSPVLMAMVNNSGSTQICSRNRDTFTLENMCVEKIFFCGNEWIGFIGKWIVGPGSD